MDVTHILLGRPWLYDLDVTNHGRENTYVFKYKGNNIILTPAKPSGKANRPKRRSSPQAPLRKSLHILSHRAFEREGQRSRRWLAIVARETLPDSTESKSDFPLEVRKLLEEFLDVMPDELPSELPPMRDIQHAIDLVPGS